MASPETGERDPYLFSELRQRGNRIANMNNFSYPFSVKSNLKSPGPFYFTTCDTHPPLKHLLRTYFGRKIRKMKTIKYFVCSGMIIVTLSHAVLRNISYKLQAGKTNYRNIHSDGRLPRKMAKSRTGKCFCSANHCIGRVPQFITCSYFPFQSPGKGRNWSAREIIVFCKNFHGWGDETFYN